MAGIGQSNPDISALLSMLQKQSQQQQQQQHPGNTSFPSNSTSNGMPNGQGMPQGQLVQMLQGIGNNPAALSFLLNSLTNGGLQQGPSQQGQNASGTSALPAMQQGNGGNSSDQALAIARLAGACLLTDQDSSQQQNRASSSGPTDSPGGQDFISQLTSRQLTQVAPQGSNSDQALALARLAGARLLSNPGPFQDTDQQLDRSQLSGNPSHARQTNISDRNGDGNGQKSNFGFVSPNVSSAKAVSTNGAASEADSEKGRSKDGEEGGVAVPCRARGMPMDHNPLTAYFVITPDIRHGDDVVCSHSACQNAGVKFRYCSWCKAPVAKRNFRRRHNHGSNQNLDNEDADDDTLPTGVATSASEVPKRKQMAFEKEQQSSSKRIKQQDPSDDISKTPMHAVLTAEALSSRNASQTDSEKAAMQTLIKESRSNISEVRRMKWAKLLEERPQANDAESMSRWIDKILSVSDFRNALKNSELVTVTDGDRTSAAEGNSSGGGNSSGDPTSSAGDENSSGDANSSGDTNSCGDASS